jgi:hypothetical protein
MSPIPVAALSRFIIPFGGLLRGRLAARETIGATISPW